MAGSTDASASPKGTGNARVSKDEERNELGAQPVPKLLVGYAIPSVIALMVTALYNIIDQFFIGQAVGELGNAATNVAFPLTMLCMGLALVGGIGGAANFNLNMGRRRPEQAAHFAGASIMLMLLMGVALFALTHFFLEPLMRFCGATDKVLPYAVTFTGITTWGFPFLILMMGGTTLIRADGSPRYAMACTLSGAIINLILNPILVFGLGWGIAGSATATTIGQVVAGIMVIVYMLRSFKTVKLERAHFALRASYVLDIFKLGITAFITQILFIVLQVILNNSLTRYGAASAFGAEMPLAVAGIAMKMNELAFSIVIGISQGMQPIMSYNYGARHYSRVRRCYLLGVCAATVVNFIAFVCFHLFPDQIIEAFGQHDPQALLFAEDMFRIFLFFTFLNAVQPLTANFFTSIGKPKYGIFLSLTRQGIFLIPLLVILPLFLGINGIVWSAPIADGFTFIVTVFVVRHQFHRMQEVEAAGEAD